MNIKLAMKCIEIVEKQGWGRFDALYDVTLVQTSFVQGDSTFEFACDREFTIKLKNLSKHPFKLLNEYTITLK